MQIDDDMLMKFVDGELPPEEMALIATAVAGNPELRSQVQRQERLRGQLRAYFSGLEAPVPEKLVRAVRTAPVSWQWRLRNEIVQMVSLRLLVLMGGALAAGLLIGLAWPQSPMRQDAAGHMIAGGSLAHALDTLLASAGPTGDTSIGISFRNMTGRDCRTFTIGDSAGLACHDQGTWRVEMLTHSGPEDGHAVYRMAGSGMPAPLRAAVMAEISGQPFDAVAEQRARARGWTGRQGS